MFASAADDSAVSALCDRFNCVMYSPANAPSAIDAMALCCSSTDTVHENESGNCVQLMPTNASAVIASRTLPLKSITPTLGTPCR